LGHFFHQEPLCGREQDCAILFARTPAPGNVKSRLFTHLTPEEACRLHCACANDTLELLHSSLPDAAKWLFLSEPPNSVFDSGGIVVPSGFRCAVQTGDDLGDRLNAAFGQAFDSGARRVVIFGSDSPTLPRNIIQEAFRKLTKSDVVLGPALDGGYYLIGCRRFLPSLFDNVEWSTERTLKQTCAEAERQGCSVAQLQTWFDVDTWSDIQRLLLDQRAGTRLPQHVAGFLRELHHSG
jgi:rSAM/selenodomain-associated transferase 1